MIGVYIVWLVLSYIPHRNEEGRRFYIFLISFGWYVVVPLVMLHFTVTYVSSVVSRIAESIQDFIDESFHGS